MRVSAKSDYALRALIEMAGRADGRAVSAEELGRLQDIPQARRFPVVGSGAGQKRSAFQLNDYRIGHG